MNLKNIVLIATLACVVTTQSQAFNFNPPLYQRDIIFTNRYNQTAALGMTSAATLGSLYKARSLVCKNPLGALGSLYLASLGARSTVAVEEHSRKPMIFTSERFPFFYNHYYRTPQTMEGKPYAEHDHMRNDANQKIKQLKYGIKLSFLENFNNALDLAATKCVAFKQYLNATATKDQENIIKRFGR